MKKEIMIIVYLLLSLLVIAGGVYVSHFLKEETMGLCIFTLGFLMIGTVSYKNERDKK